MQPKQALFLWLIISFALLLSPAIAQADTVFTIDSMEYLHNGELITMDIAPQIIDDRTLLPVRYLAESCGAQVAWDPKNKRATLTKDQTVIQLTIGSKQIIVNKQASNMDIAPVIINDRTMLPARWVAENLGWQVAWQEENRTVTIFPRQASTDDNYINVRQAPGLEEKVLGVLPRYVIVSVLDDQNNWYKISLPDGRTGWIAGWLTTASMDQPSTNFSLLRPASAGRDNDPDVSRGNDSDQQKLLDGLGVWTSIYTELPDNHDLAEFSKAKIDRIYLQVATSYRGFPEEWQDWIDSILPAAHRAGIKVIGWAYTSLQDPVSDAELIAQVSNYRTPGGHYLDAVAADIEELPRDTWQAEAIIEEFSRAAYAGLRSGCPLLAITYPPQQRSYYPFSSMADNFNGVILMDYWHTKNRDYSEEEVAQFITQSVTVLKQAGCQVPIEVALQGCDIGAGMITAAEMRAAVIGANTAKVGYSLYCYSTCDAEVWEAFVRPVK
jgi:hypothetical protein